MRRLRWTTAMALITVAVMASSSVAAWAVAFHVVNHELFSGAAPHRTDIAILESALHGHAHERSTPAHGHAVLTSTPVHLPGKMLLLIPALLGNTPESVGASPLHRMSMRSGPTHDPPPQPALKPVLRI